MVSTLFSPGRHARFARPRPRFHFRRAEIHWITPGPRVPSPRPLVRRRTAVLLVPAASATRRPAAPGPAVGPCTGRPAPPDVHRRSEHGSHQRQRVADRFIDLAVNPTRASIPWPRGGDRRRALYKV